MKRRALERAQGVFAYYVDTVGQIGAPHGWLGIWFSRLQFHGGVAVRPFPPLRRCALATSR